jgi:hypothetical protein
MKFTLLLIAYLLAMTAVYFQTTPKVYGVSYEWQGHKGYAVVEGNVSEIIDSLQSRQMIHEIIPIINN